MRFALLLLVLALPASGRVARAQSEVSGELAGVVFEDSNRDGSRDPGEPGLAGVTVCSRSQCVATDTEGTYSVSVEPGYFNVFVSQPDGFRAARRFWTRVPADPFEWLRNFPLQRVGPVNAFTFLHASDTHLDADSLERVEILKRIVEDRQPAFVIVTGDLVRDALRVPAETAEPLFEMYREQMASFPVPVWSVPGNHENFGIERHLSGVSSDHPLYGKGMYRRSLGPSYYSFNYGGVHFVALDSVDITDKWYYGHVDATQLEWLEQDLALVPATTPVVTFNHIPFFSAMVSAWGFYPDDEGPGSTIEVDGKLHYRHVVSNFPEVRARLGEHPYPLALGGHVHAREEMVFGDRGLPTRFHQTGAVVGDSGEDYQMEMASGVTLYKMMDGQIESWEFIELDSFAGCAS